MNIHGTVVLSVKKTKRGHGEANDLLGTPLYPEVSLCPRVGSLEGEETRARRPVGSQGCQPVMAAGGARAREAGQRNNECLNFPGTALTTWSGILPLCCSRKTNPLS